MKWYPQSQAPTLPDLPPVPTHPRAEWALLDRREFNGLPRIATEEWSYEGYRSYSGPDDLYRLSKVLDEEGCPTAFTSMRPSLRSERLRVGF
jgi:hypothetical protein